MNEETRSEIQEINAPPAFHPVKIEGTGYQRFHPAVTAAHLLSIMILTMFTANPMIHGIALVSGLAFGLLINHNKGTMTFYLGIACLGALTIVTNPLISHKGSTVLFFLNSNPVTLEAVWYGVNAAILLVGVMFWCRVWNEIMTPSRIMLLLSQSFPRIGLIMSCALRFFPLLVRRWRDIRRAQMVTGGESKGLHALLQQFSALVSWSLEHSILMAASMKARGYGLKGRTNYTNYRMLPADWILLGCMAVLTAVTAYSIGNGYLDFSFYPTVSGIEAGELWMYLGCISFGLLSLFPLLFELGDMFHWKFLKLKI